MLALVLASLFQALPARAAGMPPGSAAEVASGLAVALDATLVLYSDDLDEAFLGSGFLYGDGSIAVTNHHVVGTAQTVELRTRDGRKLSARVIVRDAGRDIALIAVPGAVLGAGLQAAETPPVVGTEVYALGAPLGAEFTATRGMVSAEGRQIDVASPIRFLQHDAAVNPGSSGGPLVDGSGRLVGMNSAIADGSRMFVGIGYAMGLADLQRLMPLMLAGELGEIPRLGLRLRPVSRKIAVALGIPEDEGLLVDSVEARGIADEGGVQAGDIILAFGPGTLRRPGDLAFLIEARSNDRPELLVLRGGKRILVVLDLTPPGGILAKMGGSIGPARIESYNFSGIGVALDADLTVTGLNPGSPASYAGLATGDEILAVNGVQVADLDIAGYRITGPLVLLVRRGDSTLHVVIDPWSKGKAARPIGGANVLDPDVVIF